MTGPIPLPRNYPAHLVLCYRGVRYRPAALQLFVQRGGWGREFMYARDIRNSKDGSHQPLQGRPRLLQQQLLRHQDR